MSDVLTIGVPKGSLEESTLGLFANAGLRFYGSDRALWLSSNDPEVRPVLLRPQEIPLYVAKGDLDCGLSGLDWITETRCVDGVRILADLCYSKRTFRPVRWVLAVSEESPWQTTDDLKQMATPPVRVSTEVRRITEDWLAERGIVAEVGFSWGATEAKPPVFADAIVDCTETGSSLKANRLRILETVFESTTQFFANRETYREDEWKRTKLESIALLLKTCLAADTKVCVRAVVPEVDYATVESLIPEDASHTVWNGDGNGKHVELVVEKAMARDLLPLIARNGAHRISVTPIDMLYEEKVMEPG